MVADVEMIHGKLAELETYVRELKTLQKYTLEDLQNNLSKLWSVAHGLQLSIQIVLDVGNHLLSDKGIRAGDYTEVIDKLGKAGIIPANFAKRIRSMAGFRNVLVHGYSILDIEKVYDILQNHLGDFLRFIYYISEFIEKEQ